MRRRKAAQVVENIKASAVEAKGTLLPFASIDISLRNIGVCNGNLIIPDNGPIRILPEQIELLETKKWESGFRRVNADDYYVARRITSFLKERVSEAKVVFIELPVGSQNAGAMKSYGLSLGVSASIGKPVIDVDPKVLKKACTGTNNASKKEIIEWAYGKYPDLGWFFHQNKLQSKNEHMADAIGAVHAGITLTPFKELIATAFALSISA